MEQAVAEWLIQVVPPEYGPLFVSLAGNYDTTRPAMIAFFGAVLLFEIVVLHGVWRYFTK